MTKPSTGAPNRSGDSQALRFIPLLVCGLMVAICLFVDIFVVKKPGIAMSKIPIVILSLLYWLSVAGSRREEAK